MAAAGIKSRTPASRDVGANHLTATTANPRCFPIEWSLQKRKENYSRCQAHK